MDKTWKPYMIVLMPTAASARKRMVELISYPTPEGTIMARMIPGDPTTMIEIKVEGLKKMDNGRKYKYVHIAEVSGNGAFPEDMLRYDGAALCDHAQQEEPTDDFGRYTYRPKEPVLIYHLSTTQKPLWTPARWASFAWRITPKQVIKLGL